MLSNDTITLTFSIKKTLRKITIANSVKYVSQDSHSHSEQTKLISKQRNKIASNDKLSENILKNSMKT